MLPSLIGIVKWNLPGSEGRIPLAEKGAQGKGAQLFSPPQHTEIPERE